MSFQNTITAKGLLHSGVRNADSNRNKLSTPRLHALAVAVIIIFTAAD